MPKKKHQAQISVGDHEMSGKVYPEVTRISIMSPVFPFNDRTSWGVGGCQIDNDELPRLIQMLTERATKLGLKLS